MESQHNFKTILWWTRPKSRSQLVVRHIGGKILYWPDVCRKNQLCLKLPNYSLWNAVWYFDRVQMNAWGYSKKTLAPAHHRHRQIIGRCTSWHWHLKGMETHWHGHGNTLTRAGTSWAREHNGHRHIKGHNHILDKGITRAHYAQRISPGMGTSRAPDHNGHRQSRGTITSQRRE